jgi:hypothetical protein
MAMIDRSVNRVANSLRSIDRGLSRMDLSTSYRIRAMRLEMEAKAKKDREVRQQYDEAVQATIQKLSIILDRLTASLENHHS